MKPFKFTKRELESLPFEGKSYYARDTESKGLALRVGAGSKTFYVVKKVQGKVEYIKLGPFPEVTVEQARRRAVELQAEISKGRNPAELKRTAKQEATFGTFWLEYLDKYARVHKSASTVREDEKTYRLYLSRFATKKLSSIHRADVQRLHHEISAKGAGPTANRVIAVLRAALNVAKAWGHLPGVNPAEGIKSNRMESRDRFIQPGEMPKLWQALAEEVDINIRDFIVLALLTGQRRGNLLAMRWDQIDISSGVWRIPSEHSKNKQPITVPLVPEAVAILQERLSFCAGEWVFPGTGKTGHMVEPKKAWRRVLDRAGIDDLRIHDLRRTLGSWQARQGASLAIIGKSLGHKSQQATAIYARLDLDPVRQSVESATAAMLEAAGAKPTAEVIDIKKKA